MTTIEYIISFLLYNHPEANKLVGYTDEEKKAKKYKYNITPSKNSPLYDPKKSWDDFYEEADRILAQRAITADTDIVSLACFFLSRAEETVCKERDEHGRFLSKHSLINKHNTLFIPLIDEYSRWLMKRLDLPLPQQEFSAIHLTHDIDMLTQYHRFRGILGGIKRGEIKQLWKSILNFRTDPAYTFDWLIEQDAMLDFRDDTDIIYFIKAGGSDQHDNPHYLLKGQIFNRLMEQLKSKGVHIGLHTSYSAGADQKQIAHEKAVLETALDIDNITRNRYHYLRCSSIDNMQVLAKTGITDDFSMAFADKVGFRLQTARAVRWINPKTLELTNLTLHPLSLMDCTLSNPHYMNLDEDEAYYTCQQIIDRTRQNNGELTLLWHNSNLGTDSYHRSLYHQLLSYIREL